MKGNQCKSPAISRAFGFLADSVDAGRAGDGHTPRILTQLENSLAALIRRGEMEVGELGNGMAERVIDLAQRAISAVNVGDDSLAQMPRCRRGEGFHAIADDEDNVG